MTEQDRKVFERIYGQAESPDQLPWHTDEPPAALVRALESRSGPGRALDLGCGAGTFSLYLARQGYAVTALDFMPQAVAMTRQRAEETGLEIDVREADVTRWQADEPYDVVLDVGCLHSLPRSMRAAYRERLMQWLAPGADFILTHFSSRGWWDWWPIGPNRVSRDRIVGFLGTELELIESESTLRTGFPWFMGGAALIGSYRFRRPRRAQS